MSWKSFRTVYVGAKLDFHPLHSAFTTLAARVIVNINVCVLVLIFHIVFRLLLTGSLSRFPCGLFDLAGSMSKFASIEFVALNFVSIFLICAHRYDFATTLKTGWPNVLG